MVFHFNYIFILSLSSFGELILILRFDFELSGENLPNHITLFDLRMQRPSHQPFFFVIIMFLPISKCFSLNFRVYAYISAFLLNIKGFHLCFNVFTNLHGFLLNLFHCCILPNVSNYFLLQYFSF